MGRWSIEQTVKGGPEVILQREERLDFVERRKGGNGPWYIDGGLVERSVDVVDGNRVVRIGGITTDVDYDSERSFLTVSGDGFGRDEGGDFLAEVDAVDEDIGYGIDEMLE